MSGPFGSTAWMYATDSGFYDFEISNSLRFNDNDSAYLTRTHSSGGDRQTWTWSGWVKRGNIASSMVLFSTRNSSNDRVMFYIHSSGTLEDLNLYLNIGGTATELKTNRVFRDSSAWYHMMVHVDTTQGTASNRAKMYVNGEQITSFATGTYPAQNASTAVNLTNVHYIGINDSGNGDIYDGYLADVNFIDGTALTPSSFGETKNDIWIPKDTSGLTFGTTGFRLQYKQTGTGTASSSTIGADTSGNTNHWTSNNLASTDVVPDSPTNNFCTPNALDNMNWLSQGLGRVTRSEGSLQMSGDSWITKSTFGMLTGKWYWEVRLEGGAVTAGIHLIDGLQNTHHAYYYYGYTANNIYKYAGNATLFDGSTVSANSILGVAFDADNLTLQYFIAGSSIHTVSDVDAGKYSPSFGTAASSTLQVNFGQDSSFAGNETAQGNTDENGIGDFYYAPPSGYLALCTANLPDPVETIDPAKGGSPQDYFQTKLYTGNGQSSLDIDLDFTPNFVWIKDREGTYSHILANSVSGDDKFLASNATGAEETDNTKFRNFLTKAFRVGSHNGVNASNNDYVSWNWKAGTAFSNDASATSVGSIDSAGSVNTDLGFSIINFTGTGNVQTIAHGLSQAPELIIEKSRDKNDYWLVYAAYLGNTKGLILGNTDSVYTSTTFWNDTSPTSSVWTMGDQNAVNNSGEETIAFCFHSVENYSKIGSYIGNESTDGTFIYTGFRPAFILIKKEAAGDWGIYDSKRLGYNDDNAVLYPAGNNAEENQASRRIDLLSNGFKLRTTNVTFNDDSTTLFVAFAEQPFKYANAR